MIQEWLWAATATASPTVRRLGYPRELARHAARAGRQAAAWAPHLEKSRQCILDAIRETEKRDLAIVAGSGPCLDVPLQELSESFKKVVLVDVVHPRATRKTAARLGNVVCRAGDLTGILEDVALLLRAGAQRPLPRPTCALLPASRPDLVVSANTLSQLPLIPMERLWGTGRYDDGQLASLARDIVQAHLDWLESLGGVLRLITDILWLRTGDGRPLASDPLHGIRLPAPLEQWTWRAAPKPEAHPVCDIVHVVAAFAAPRAA